MWFQNVYSIRERNIGSSINGNTVFTEGVDAFASTFERDKFFAYIGTCFPGNCLTSVGCGSFGICPKLRLTIFALMELMCLLLGLAYKIASYAAVSHIGRTSRIKGGIMKFG